MQLIPEDCSRYLSNRCYLYNTSSDNFRQSSQTIAAVTNVINSIASTNSDPAGCADIYLALVCNSLYPGCNPENEDPIALCEDACVEYSSSTSCSEFYRDVEQMLEVNKGTSMAGLRCDVNDSYHSSGSTSGMECYSGKINGLPYS